MKICRMFTFLLFMVAGLCAPYACIISFHANALLCIRLCHLELAKHSSDFRKTSREVAAALSKVLRTTLLSYGIVQLSYTRRTGTSQPISIKLCRVDDV
jgi:hypothetical protein